ncbi:MAG TPA: hypothetical protein VD929_05080 [Caulobacteraceae bacterium]|nr:hypothetical protein [Caulobacteraceae bacterium]
MIRKSVGLALCAALTAGTAGAGDTLFNPGKKHAIIDYWAGKPMWQLHAHCAGVFGAFSNHAASTGDAAGAASAKSAGVRHLDLALRQLKRDRELERKNALQVAEPYVAGGRTVGEAAIGASAGEMRGTSAANFRRSECLELPDHA